MEGFSLSRDKKVPKKNGFCMGAHSQDKPARHDKSSHWYAFKLHKAAGCSTWRFLFGAQHMQRDKLPQFLRSFLQAQEPVLAQIAAEGPADEEVTLYILGPNKAPVGVCSQQWQAMTDAKANGDARNKAAAQQQQSDDQQSDQQAGAETHAAAAGGDAIVPAVQQQLLAPGMQLALVQQLQERDAQLAALQDEYARLKSYMQLQRDEMQAQHAGKLALMAANHVRGLDVHEGEIMKLRHSNAVLHFQLDQLKGAHEALQQQHQQLQRQYEEAQQQQRDAAGAASSSEAAGQGPAKRQRTAADEDPAAAAADAADKHMQEEDPSDDDVAAGVKFCNLLMQLSGGSSSGLRMACGATAVLRSR